MTDPPPVRSRQPSVAETSGQVERLLSELESAGDPAVARRAEALVRALVELYGAGLARVLHLARASGDVLGQLATDPLVSGLLVLHDLHPATTEQRVHQALTRVRPFLGQHAGDVELVEVGESRVRLRLAGNCHGCPSSEQTVRQAIETAITAAAPEIAQVEVEGVVPEPAPAAGPLLQIERTPPHPYAGADCPADPVAGGTR